MTCTDNPSPPLQDIYDPRERGTVVGIYYSAPLLGPSIGPLIGGVATQLFSWRATFFFLVIFAGLSLLSFLFFKDTFRRERSLSYQGALRKAIKERDAKLRVAEESVMPRKQDLSKDEKREQDATPSDLEVAPNADQSQPVHADVRMSFGDIIPVRPVASVLRRMNNVTTFFPSGQFLLFSLFSSFTSQYEAWLTYSDDKLIGLLFGFTYCITYTAVRTLAAAPYFYGALDIGLVLLSFGIGGYFVLSITGVGMSGFINFFL